MKPLKSGICDCQDRGFFVLAGKRTPCPLCAGNTARFAPIAPDDAQQQIAKLERKLAVSRRAGWRMRATNRKLGKQLQQVIAVAETAGIDLTPGRAWGRKRK